MQWAPIHTQGRTLDEHFENMRTMLATGEVHFLIGGIVDEKGVRPVTFIRNIDDETARYLSDITSPIVKAILDQIGPLLYANLKQENVHQPAS